MLRHVPMSGGEGSARGALESEQRVLVVDDYPANLLALQVALRPLGATLVEARSGTEAIAHAAERRFDGILMDVRMSDLSGLEACAQIRSSTPNRNTPVLFHSAEDLSAEEMEEARRLSPRDILRKPVDPADLVVRVRALLAAPHG
jgi:CheY-like chemotaxis protein